MFLNLTKLEFHLRLIFNIIPYNYIGHVVPLLLFRCCIKQDVSFILVFLFNLSDTDKQVKDSQGNHKKLGAAGLALHYANIITQIDTLVS
jgi:hypothetical protein